MLSQSLVNPQFRSKFAEDIFNQKYRHEGAETWNELCVTLVEDVVQDKMSKEEKGRLIKYMQELKVIAGGRYLYYAGRASKFFNNCFLLRAEEDTREDWADLSWKSESCLMTGGGIGVDYSRYRGKGRKLSRTGGLSSGPIPKMQMINEIGRHVMQGGSRRSAIYASLNWQHTDVNDFLKAKDWKNMPVGTTGFNIWDLKQQDFNYPAPLDMTNISVNYDTAWLEHYKATGDYGSVFLENVKQSLQTAEPGFSFNFYDKENETLRNAPIAADTWVMTRGGYRQVSDIVGVETELWTGLQWAPATFKRTAEMVPTICVGMTGGRSITADPSHEFFVETPGQKSWLPEHRRVPASELKVGDTLWVSLQRPRLEHPGHPLPRDVAMYVRGFAYGDGSFNKKYPNRAEITFCSEDKKECYRAVQEYPFLSVNEDDGRGYIRAYIVDDWFVGKNKSEFPEISTQELRSFLAGLFDADGSYDKKQNRVRVSSVHLTFLEGVRRALEMLGIQSGISTAGVSSYGNKVGYTLTVNSSHINEFCRLIETTRLKIEYYDAYRSAKIKVTSLSEGRVQDVYCCDVGVEEHSFCAEGVIISNCTEVTSEDDSDVCNLASPNLGRIENIEEFSDIIELTTKFLLCGTMRADLPYEKVYKVREQNRRLGVGLMGVHEWLIKRGYRYEATPELHQWLEVYRDKSEEIATSFAAELSVSRPKGVRAIAPTGTIGILAGTTTGIEPLFAVAYRRRYLKGKKWHFQYVVDSAAQEMIEFYGADPDNIESALDLAKDYERRMKMQADIQDYVDQSISSTINLPAWGTSHNNEDKVVPFAKKLAKYAHRLRGFTSYADGARGGQPLTSIDYHSAKTRLGEEFEESIQTMDICEFSGKSGGCGI